MSSRIVRHRPSQNSLAPFDASLGNFFGDFWEPSPFFTNSLLPDWGTQSQWIPLMDVIEEENQFITEVELPGFDPEDVSVEIENNFLVLSGKKDSSEKDKKGTYLRSDRSTASFYQKVQFPSTADLDKAECSSKHGVLTILVPKKKQNKKKLLEIKKIK